MEIKFIIMGRKRDGSEFECFHWTRDAETGKNRARREAIAFGIDMVEVWAVPVKEN